MHFFSKNESPNKPNKCLPLSELHLWKLQIRHVYTLTFVDGDFLEMKVIRYRFRIGILLTNVG